MNYHQGDVFLRRIKQIPDGAKFARRDIVAYGEITGHKHSVVDSLFYERNGESYLRVERPEKMLHDSHPPTEIIDKGDYQVIIQEEYFPEGFKKVVD